MRTFVAGATGFVGDGCAGSHPGAASPPASHAVRQPLTRLSRITLLWLMFAIRTADAGPRC